MIEPTELTEPEKLFEQLAGATSTKAILGLLAALPVVSENDYSFDEANPEQGWVPGALHWHPVGRDRGNAGRIKLAGSPENPIAERTINAMEALIELERQREMTADPSAAPPPDPQQAALRYFGLPALASLPGWTPLIRDMKAKDLARQLARRIKVRLVRETSPVEYTITVEDDGIGQAPPRMHRTLLALGRSDKPDKPYLVGVFGQGGSSAYAACHFSVMVSRRAPDLPSPDGHHGVGWTIVKRILPAERRDVYWAYLAAHPDGRVPRFPAHVADAVGFERGTRIAHINYDFGKTEPARTLYQSLNHLLFNPVLPYELYTGASRPAELMYGNGYRLSRLREQKKLALDKAFAPQSVELAEGTR